MDHYFGTFCCILAASSKVFFEDYFGTTNVSFSSVILNLKVKFRKSISRSHIIIESPWQYIKGLILPQHSKCGEHRQNK